MQIILTVIVMITIFTVIIIQARRTAKIVHEKEINETANRIKQEEMEEKIRLQNKILEEEKQRHRQDEMIRALSSDYRSVFYYDLEKDEGVCYRSRRNTHDENEIISPFSKMLEDYLKKSVVENYLDNVLKFIRPENLRKGLQLTNIISYRYLAAQNNRQYYEMIRVAKIDDGEEIHAVGVGFANVDEQTREAMVQNQILADALAQAQHANISKTTFLSNMSHDIRTPMNAIIGFTTMALRHFDNQAQVKDSLEKVLSSSNHLLGLINDILDMSRIDSGRVEIQEQECNLSELVHSLIHIIQPQITAKQQLFHIDAFQVKNEYVHADQLKINQVLINILSNAVKYTPATGTISFRISQFDSDKPGYAKYEFRVKDNGMGMSKEFLKHIFDPFERDLSNTKTLGIQGTGLGMTITKKMVELMNGKIEVESELDKGSEFIVTLELKLQENVKYLINGELEGLRVLVVDDDFETCDSVTEILKNLGVRSEWTTSPREAVFRAKKALNDKDPFNAYIVDWLMRELNGIETVRQLRRVVGNDAPIVILTAYDYSDIENEARSAGVTEFCTKPLFMSDLKKVLSRATGNFKVEEKKTDDLTETDFTGKRVLLVEDVEVNREIAKAVLSETGLEVEDAPDGIDAVEIFQRSKKNYYDLILMDIQMPKMNGYEATKKIRALERDDAKNIPIIAMTANAFEEDKTSAFNAGMNDHVAKPLDIPKLLATLKKYLH
ncbi:MAG: response regulator [Selenomonadaceae bacterium]|nr:response regulator [Selenomonadaceae bacterium]